MAEIPRSLLDGLASEVGALSDAATTQTKTALEQIVAAWDGSDVAALRNAAIQVLQTVVPVYSELSAARAAEFYDIVRQLQGVAGSYQATVLSGYLAEADEQAIRALLQSVVETGDTDLFISNLLSRVDAEIRKSANRCIVRNASADPASPSYALVPSGLETCGFCLMLASFGFQYSAPFHAHANCDCRIVPSFSSDTTVEGYDPDGLYDIYLKAREQTGKLAPTDVEISRQIEKVLAERRSNATTLPSDSVIFKDRQVGRKAGKHAGEWGLNPGIAADREEFVRITRDIIDNADQVTYGKWHDQEPPVAFYRKGNDVVLVNALGEYVTTMRGGASNATYKRTL